MITWFFLFLHLKKFIAQLFCLLGSYFFLVYFGKEYFSKTYLTKYLRSTKVLKLNVFEDILLNSSVILIRVFFVLNRNHDCLRCETMGSRICIKHFICRLFTNCLEIQTHVREHTKYLFGRCKSDTLRLNVISTPYTSDL